jgi:hypothetical protein
MVVKAGSRKQCAYGEFKVWLRQQDDSELIRLYHTEREEWVDEEYRAYFADELLRRGFNW